MKMIQKIYRQIKPLQFPNLCYKLPDDEIAEDISSLNSKQKEVFNIVHARPKDNVKYDEHDVETVHI